MGPMAAGFRQPLSCRSAVLIEPRAGPVGKESTSSWLFHIDAPHVLLTGWDVVLDGDKVTGVKMRVSEVDGRPGRAGLH